MIFWIIVIIAVIAVGTPCFNDLLDAFEREEIYIEDFEIEDMRDVNLDVDLSYDKDGCAKIIYLNGSEEV